MLEIINYNSSSSSYNLYISILKKLQFKIVNEDLSLIEKELEQDVADAERINKSHTHDLPTGITGPARKPGQKGRKFIKSSDDRLEKLSSGKSEFPVETNGEVAGQKNGLLSRIFRRKGRA